MFGGGGSQTGFTFGTGQPAQQPSTQPLFGTPPTSNPQPTTGFAFGSPATAAPTFPFGGSNAVAPTTSQPAGGIFGAANPPLGSSSFGGFVQTATLANPANASSAPTFGMNTGTTAPAQTSIFGSSGGTTALGYGTTPGTFGANATNAPIQPVAPAGGFSFGAVNPAPATGSIFGGASAQPAQPLGSTMGTLFGGSAATAASTVAAPSLFGAPTPVSTQQNVAFGFNSASAPALSSTAAVPTSGFAFGPAAPNMTVAPTSSAPTGVFGAPSAAPSTTTSITGFLSSTPAVTGGSGMMFPPSTLAQTTGGPFGFAPAPNTSTTTSAAALGFSLAPATTVTGAPSAPILGFSLTPSELQQQQQQQEQQVPPTLQQPTATAAPISSVAITTAPIFSLPAATSVSTSPFMGATTAKCKPPSSLAAPTTAAPLLLGSNTTSAASTTAFSGFTIPKLGTSTPIGTTAAPAITTVPAVTSATTGITFGTGAATIPTTTATTSSFGFGLAPKTTGTSLFGTTVTASATASPGSFSLSGGPTPSATTATGLALLPAPATTTTTSTAAPLGGTGMNFRQLEESINKWTMELEEQEKMYLNQATQVNAWDRMLIQNGDTITQLNDSLERVKLDQQRLDHEIDFILAQQRELEDLLVPLEQSLEQMPAVSVQQHADLEREHTYQLAENIDAQLKRMAEDLKEIISHVNSSNSVQDTSDPIHQVGKILNAHMDSLQWIEQNTSLVQRKLEEVSQLYEVRRKDQERRFRLAYD